MSNEHLLEPRIANALLSRGCTAEPKKMFGGVAFMVRGHMTVGVTNKGYFMARFDKARHDEILAWPGASPMTFGKGDMKGFLFVDPTAVRTAPTLGRWLDLALEYNATLGAKKKGGTQKPAMTTRAARK